MGIIYPHFEMAFEAAMCGSQILCWSLEYSHGNL